jgi:outer membrane protein assembly factor BamB
VGSCSSVLYALDKRTGQLVWKFDAGADGEPTEFHADAVIEGSLLLIGTDQRREHGIGHVYAFDRETGTVRWKVPAAYGFPADFARSGGNLIASNFSGELLGLEMTTGEVRWKHSSPSSGPDFALPLAPAVRADRVFFAERTGKILALDSRTGGVLWSRELKDQVNTSVLLAGATVFVGTSGKRVYAIDSGDGKILADHALEEVPAGKPAASDDSIYILTGGTQSCCSSIVSLDRSLKQVRWTQKAPEGTLFDSPRPLVWRDSVLAGTDHGELRALKLTDGSLLWKHEFQGAIRSIGAADGILYVGTQKGTLYAFDPGTRSGP